MTTSQHLWDAFELVVQQLPLLKLLLSSKYLKQNVPLELSVEKTVNRATKSAFRANFKSNGAIGRWTNAHSYLIADLELPFLSISDLRSQMGDEHSDEICYSVAYLDVADNLEATLFDLMVAVNIAQVGVFRFEDGLFQFDDQHYRINTYLTSCGDAREFIKTDGWPQIASCAIQETFDWYRALSGTTHGYSDTPVARAACAFSYLFHSNFEHRRLTDLIWALAGIEALLGEADQSRRLISDKALLIFPSTDETAVRKLMRQLYDFRSRMLHGNRNISSRRLEYENEDKPRKYIEEEWDATNLALILLSQLLLFCKSHGLREIRTTLQLSEL